MSEENHKPRSKVTTAISIVVPLLPVLAVVLFYTVNHEFREYINETACEGFASAREVFEMLEYVIPVLCGLVIVGFLYVFYVLKIRKITAGHKETILEFLKDETPLILLLMVMLMVSILIYAPYQKYKEDQDTIARLVGTLTNRKSKPLQPPAPLPMKAIPPAEVTMPIAEAHQKASGAEQTGIVDFEKDFAPTNNSVMGEVEKIQEQNKINALNAKKAADKATYDYWTNALPYYEQTLLTLRDILRQSGATSGEIETHPAPPEFLHCLPASISPEDTDKNLGEIKLSKNKNLDFTIQIRGNPDQQRFMIVSCVGGFVMFHPHPNGSQFCYGIKAGEMEYTELTCSFNDSKQKVADCLAALIDYQITHNIQTNNVSQ